MTATRPGRTASTSSAAATGHGPGQVAGGGRARRRPVTWTIRGSTPVRRTGLGGVSSGAATARTRPATARTSAGVR